MSSKEVRYEYRMLRWVYGTSCVLYGMVLAVVVLYGVTAVRGGSYVPVNLFVGFGLGMVATVVLLRVRKFVGHLKALARERSGPDATMQMLFEAAIALAILGLIPLLWLGAVFSSRPI